MVAQIVLCVVGVILLLMSLVFDMRSLPDTVIASCRMVSGWICLSAAMIIHHLVETRKVK